MGATYEQEQRPRRRPHDSSDDSGGKNCVLAIIMGFLGAAMMIGFCAMLFQLIRDPTLYSIAIAAASGLDYDGGIATAAVLNPEFNVTVRVTSRSKDEACLDPATSVQVSYLRVPLAGGDVRPDGGGSLCAPPWKHADHAVVARGKAVAVPGFLMDSLAEDMRTGEAMFQVTLMSPYEYGRYWDVYTCWGKVGDAAALDRSCPDSLVVADVLPVPQPGGQLSMEITSGKQHGSIPSFIWPI